LPPSTASRMDAGFAGRCDNTQFIRFASAGGAQFGTTVQNEIETRDRNAGPIAGRVGGGAGRPACSHQGRFSWVVQKLGRARRPAAWLTSVSVEVRPSEKSLFFTPSHPAVSGRSGTCRRPSPRSFGFHARSEVTRALSAMPRRPRSDAPGRSCTPHLGVPSYQKHQPALTGSARGLPHWYARRGPGWTSSSAPRPSTMSAHV
jgi:hypothetical protein